MVLFMGRPSFGCLLPIIGLVVAAVLSSFLLRPSVQNPVVPLSPRRRQSGNLTEENEVNEGGEDKAVLLCLLCDLLFNIRWIGY